LRQRHHRPFFFFLLTILLFAPTSAGGQQLGTDSLKNNSIDRCGNLKSVNAPIINPISPTSSEEIPSRKEKLIVSGSKGTAYFFLGSLCPCTDAHKHSIMELMSLAPKKNVKLVAVFPNKGESVELIEHFFKGVGFKLNYLVDSTNRLVKRFGAKKTPEVFLIDEKGRVVYSGPIDDSVENLGQIKNAYLKNAVLDLAEGRPVSVPRAEGSGCWIVRNR